MPSSLTVTTRDSRCTGPPERLVLDFPLQSISPALGHFPAKSRRCPGEMSGLEVSRRKMLQRLPTSSVSSAYRGLCSVADAGQILSPQMQSLFCYWCACFLTLLSTKRLSSRGWCMDGWGKKQVCEHNIMYRCTAYICKIYAITVPLLLLWVILWELFK